MKTYLVVGALLSALVVAGPAVAWDLTTEAPRAKLPSPWPEPKPWTGAGARIATAARGMARLYLPRATPAPPDEDTPVSAPSAASAFSAAAATAPAGSAPAPSLAASAFVGSSLPPDAWDPESLSGAWHGSSR